MNGLLKYYKVYRKNPRNLFELVINPINFAQSVENLFYLSFLVRDGNIQFETRDGVPVICKFRCPAALFRTYES